MPTAGESLFARYAYPPNELGYCGVGDGAELLESASGESEQEIRSSARGFDGAWPYLEIIAASTGTTDPLDEGVVEAYWIGNSLLDSVEPAVFAAEVRDRFASQSGADWNCLDAKPVPVAHHSFHVFAIYPWTGLMRAGKRGPALEVLDRCRIGWGEVVGVDEDRIDVRHQQLDYDGSRFTLGEWITEPYRWRQAGRSLSGPVATGAWVATHWGWVCGQLSESQVAALAYYTTRQLEATNASAESAT
jgi:hypothetical protein